MNQSGEVALLEAAQVADESWHLHLCGKVGVERLEWTVTVCRRQGLS
jgi:hypothetical protein